VADRVIKAGWRGRPLIATPMGVALLRLLRADGGQVADPGVEAYKWHDDAIKKTPHGNQTQAF